MAAENVAVALTHPIVVALERKLATFSQVAPAKKRMKKASKYPAIQGLHLMYQAIASLPPFTRAIHPTYLRFEVFARNVTEVAKA